jgi:DNA-binding transcriptional ArsR family regulator
MSMTEYPTRSSEKSSGQRQTDTITSVNPSNSKWSWFRQFMNETSRHVPANAALVWLTMLSRGYGSSEIVGQAELAELTGLSIRTVERAIHTLKEKGLLCVIKRGNNITQQVSEYGLRPTIHEPESQHPQLPESPSWPCEPPF